jgi:hypothetical protein
MKGIPVAIVILALIVILILAGLGFALHVLWWIALAALVIWLLGFALRAGETVGGPRRRRWYYW